MLLRNLLSLLLVLVLSASAATASAKDDWHTWGAVVATGTPGDASSNLRYWLEGQGRFTDDSSRFGQGIVRGALGYVFAPRATLWAGYAYIPNDPPNRSDNIVEHRAWQQLTWSTAEPVGGLPRL